VESPLYRLLLLLLPLQLPLLLSLACFSPSS